MSVPGALKLTLIIALKMITKQQELADISGGRRVSVDGMMLTKGYEMKSESVCCDTIVIVLLKNCSVTGAWAVSLELQPTRESELVINIEKMCFMILKTKIKQGLILSHHSKTSYVANLTD